MSQQPGSRSHWSQYRPLLSHEPSPNVYVLFCNETEAATIAETEGWEVKDVGKAKKLAALLKNGSKPRTVVIMQGADLTIVGVGGDVTEYPIIALPKATRMWEVSCLAWSRKRVWRAVVPLAHMPQVLSSSSRGARSQERGLPLALRRSLRKCTFLHSLRRSLPTMSMCPSALGTGPTICGVA